MTNTNATPIPPLPSRTAVRDFFHDAATWVQDSWANILIAAGIAVGVVLALHLIRAWGLRQCRRGDGNADWRAILGRTIAKTGNFFIILAAIRLVVGYAAAPEPLAWTVKFLFLLVATFQAAIWLRELIFGVVEQRTLAEGETGAAYSSAMGIIRLLVSIVLFAIAIVVVLSNLHVNVTGLVAGLGIGGIAIGLAAQGIFADLFAALAILLDRPFRVGDNISYDSTRGTVVAIGLKSTRIRSFDGDLLVIANRTLLDKEIHNLADREHIRITLALGLAYETDPDTLDRVPEMLRGIVEAAGANPVRASFEGFGASTLDYVLLFDVDGGVWDLAHATRDRVATAILRRFRKEGIGFAYPSQTTFTAAPDGRLIMPYPEVQPVRRVDKGKHEE